MSFSDAWWLRDTLAEGRLTDQHANRIHQWELQASTLLEGYSDWPRLKQVLRLKREVGHKGNQEIRREMAYAITSLSRERGEPLQLIKLWREHWHIENRLHWVRDVTFDEDRSQVRAGHIPQVMAAFRNVAISLMRLMGASNIAAACRRYAARPDLALAARRLAEFLGSIVIATTGAVSDQYKMSDVSCRRRPHRRPCTGKIWHRLNRATSRIEWYCPVCADNGLIPNWQGTIWDCHTRSSVN
jgi:hypothetical protein